jgi:hypothetical protein
MNCSGSWGRADGCGSPSTGRSGITTSRCGWPRAIPVQVAAFRKTPIFRSQNLRLLVHTLRETGRTAVLLGDRGFHRVSWFQLLLERKPSFVVRRVADLKVYAGTHEGRLLRHWPLHPGQAVDLRQDKAVRVRVLGVWAPGQEEPWWLATDLPDPLADLVALYDRRMGLEEQLRDTKGCRFGVKFRTPEYLARFTLLLWTAVGQAVAQATPSVRLPCKQKGPRLSLLRVGIGPAESD